MDESEDSIIGVWTYPWWFFSLARFNVGGPTYYGEVVRMPADRYLTRTVMGIIATAITFFLVLVIILPIIKNRVHSLIAAVNSIGIGVAISLCLICPSWLKGFAVIQSTMNYQSKNEYIMEIGLHIGLASSNITLTSLSPIVWRNDSGTVLRNSTFFYNEKVPMFKPELLESSMDGALAVGLPVPLLTAIHFLTSATLDFHWSQDVMEAGYHCYLILVFALLVWFLALLFIAAIPRYSCYSFIVIGVLMISTNVIYFYWVMLDHHFPPFFISGQFIELRYGTCFWGCLAVGIWSCIYGFSLSVYDLIHPDKFLTIFDIDYDHKRSLATAHRLNQFSGYNREESSEYVHPEPQL